MYESKVRVFFRGVLWWSLGLWLFYRSAASETAIPSSACS